jgi:hypothetical protein
VRVALVACALVGCGRLDFGAITHDGTVDACTLGAFTTPTLLPGPVQSPDDDWYPTPTLGETQLYFHSFRTGSLGADLWYATRADLASPFGTPIRIVELATSNDETTPTLSEDALDLIYASGAELSETQRANTTDSWPTSVALASVNSGTETSPFIDAAGLRLVFASAGRADGVGGLDLYETTRADRQSPFQPAVHLSTLASTEDDFAPTLSADGLEIIFSSARSGSSHIYTARRATLEQPFAAPIAIPAVTSMMDDVGSRLAPNGRTLYFNYNTLTLGGANADLWTATRACQ